MHENNKAVQRVHALPKIPDIRMGINCVHAEQIQCENSKRYSDEAVKVHENIERLIRESQGK